MWTTSGGFGLESAGAEPPPESALSGVIMGSAVGTQSTLNSLERCRELSFRKRAKFLEKVWKTKIITVRPLLCLSRCRGLGLFSLVVAKSVFPSSNHNFIFFQSSPTLIQTFRLEGLCARGAKHLHRKTFLYNVTRKTSC